MKAYFKSLKWNKGSRELVQGIKKNRVPRNAVYGGKGSYICETPSELILTVTTEEGRDISRNIISLVRAVNGWIRITNKRVEVLEAKLQKISEFSLDGRDYVINLENYICA